MPIYGLQSIAGRGIEWRHRAKVTCGFMSRGVIDFLARQFIAQWALSDMHRKSNGSNGRRQADSRHAAEKAAAEEGADSRPTPRGDIFFGEV